MKYLKIALIIVVLGAVVIQLVPYGRNHINPPVLGEPNWDSPETRELFYRACGDCHTNETVWPWYSNIAPVSWLVQHDVDEGRHELNLSEWGYIANKEADESSEAIEEGEMPMPVYLITHPEARLTEAEKEALMRGLDRTFDD
ncbi:MAG: heme-binding domain-containing protein [Chloroflexi bacterium]|nr:heme-binding domain-containing protein [Chloroflexota bacterium]